MRFEVRVKPGSKVPSVGGSWSESKALVVAVKERAVDGMANKAVVRAIAAALGVANGSVVIVRGEKSRTKLVEVLSDDSNLAGVLERLRRRR